MNSPSGPGWAGSGPDLPIIELRGISKRFPGVVANRDVSLAVARGEVHALVGENGAGKTTLMKILYGLLRPDAGEICVDGAAVRFSSPAAALARGIGMVQQHVLLAENLTVLENVIIGAEPVRAGRLDLAAARARLRDLAARYGLPVDPDARVASLGVGERQRVEILRILSRGVRILVLDEPTAVLAPREADDLLASLRHLAAGGLTVIFISHRLDEVLRVADRITVMRGGATVATVRPGDVTAAGLARLMVGSDLPAGAPRTTAVGETRLLEIRGLRVGRTGGTPALDGIDLAVHRGEIVGIAGVEGNGQAELFAAVLGLQRPDSGAIRIGGADVTGTGVAARRAAGLAAIPPDRQREGLLLEAPIWENRILGGQRRAPASRRGWLTLRAAREDTRALVAAADVRTPSIEVAASALSGGNQQKLIVGRELRGAPRLLLAAHPTRGVDVGAQAEIWGELGRARDAGLGVLLISADLAELLALSDRIAVLLRGRIVAVLPAADATPELLGAAMTGAGE